MQSSELLDLRSSKVLELNAFPITFSGITGVPMPLDVLVEARLP